MGKQLDRHMWQKKGVKKTSYTVDRALNWLPVVVVVLSLLSVFVVYAIFRVELSHHVHSVSTWVVLAIGLGMCVILAVVLYIIERQRRQTLLALMQQTQDLKRQQATTHLLLNSVGEGIYGLDSQGRTTFINPAAEEMLGYSAAELIGQPMHDLVHHSYPDGSRYLKEDCPMYAAFTDGQVHRRDNEVLWRKDGSAFWVEYTSTPIIESGNIIGAVVVFMDVSLRHETERRLEKIARFDALTQLPNRVHFLEAVGRCVARNSQEQKVMAVCIFDVDNFKHINDNLGHPVGDQLLQVIAKRLYGQLRDFDFLARLGGDEFGLVIDRLYSANEADAIIHDYIRCFEAPIYLEGHELQLCLSVGIAVYPTSGEDVDELVKNADIALYRAKEAGKNTHAFYNERMNEAAKRRHEVSTSLPLALRCDELSLVYQPQIDSRSEKILGFEALLRWNNQHLGQVSPAEFIPIAEESGLINTLGEWVLHRACKDFQQSLLPLLPGSKLSVNTSIRQLENAQFSQIALDVLQSYALPASSLYLEVTETLLMQKPKKMIPIMQMLSQKGIQFALDDFGTGHSSMQYLKLLPISVLKIDRSFVQELESKGDIAIVEAMIQLAKSLHIQTIAEGVETPAQTACLRELDCDAFQGYHFAKPMPLEVLLPWVQQYKVAV